MADSILHLGDYPVFDLNPNWFEELSSEFLLARYSYKFPGGIQTMYEQSADVPILFEAAFDMDKAKEKYFLDFIHGRIGKTKKFWVKAPMDLYGLKSKVSFGESLMKLYSHHLDLSLRGYERIYIEMKNGDLITRKIETWEYKDTDQEVWLYTSAAIDRDIEIDPRGYFQIGRILLCRFENEAFPLSLHTDRLCTVKLKFYELVKEYSDIT